MKQMLEDNENRAIGAPEGDETFKGTSLDSIFAAGIGVAVDTALEPSAAAALWQKCVDHAPEIAVGVAVAKFKITALTAIIAGIAAASIVIGAGIMMAQFAYNSQPGSGDSMSITHQTWFIPDFVSINYQSRDASDPETYNPIFAEIELSDGFPVEWRIIDSNEITIAQGSGGSIEQRYFDPLRAGVYRAEWKIENAAGDSGVA